MGAVVGSTDVDRAPGADSRDDDERGVEYRGGDEEHGGNCTRKVADAGPQFECDHGEQEAEEQRTRITHEDARGVPVVDEKAETRRRDHHCEPPDKDLALEQRGHRERGRDRGRDRSSRAVHVVEQVERVGEHHEREHAQHDINLLAEHLDARACRHGEQSGPQFDEQTRHRSEMAHIVEEPGEGHDARRHQDQRGVFRIALPAREKQRTQNRADRDRHTAEVRGGIAVRLARLRCVAETPGEREPAAEWDERDDENECQCACSRHTPPVGHVSPGSPSLRSRVLPCGGHRTPTLPHSPAPPGWS